MNIFKNRIVKNVSFVLMANIITTIGSAVLSILIPKFISPLDYGYWQLHNLYGGYIALLHFGWVDGVYIRYAGIKYENLDKSKQHNQFILLTLVELLISIAGVAVAFFVFHNDIDKFFAVGTVFAASFISIPFGFLSMVMQGCSRIKQYSISTIISKLLYLVLSVFLFLIGKVSYKLIILASIIGAIVSMGYAVIKCKDIVFTKGKVFSSETIAETFENIKCGIKVTLAYLSGAFIVGSIRYFIEGKWGVETFGQASLTISLSSLILVFINAVGIVLIPVVRNIRKESREETYEKLYSMLSILILFAFILYYPFSKILILILPKYTESIKMMALIFPLCLFEGKMGLLNNVYLKALRKENGLLIINLISCALTVVLSALTVFAFENFELSVMLIVAMLGLRCSIADIYISRSINAQIYKWFIMGIIMSALFISINKFISPQWLNLIIYSSAFVTLILFSVAEIKDDYRWLKMKLLN